MTRVLALDYGIARCGVAVSDPSGTLATPLAAVERPATRRGLTRLQRLVEERHVERVIVGLPLTLRGEEGPQAVETRAFAERLAERIRRPVELRDERLTTREARAIPGRADLDSRAAAVLLESYLAAPGAAA